MRPNGPPIWIAKAFRRFLCEATPHRHCARTFTEPKHNTAWHWHKYTRIRRPKSFRSSKFSGGERSFLWPVRTCDVVSQITINVHGADTLFRTHSGACFVSKLVKRLCGDRVGGGAGLGSTSVRFGILRHQRHAFILKSLPNLGLCSCVAEPMFVEPVRAVWRQIRNRIK